MCVKGPHVCYTKISKRNRVQVVVKSDMLIYYSIRCNISRSPQYSKQTIYCYQRFRHLDSDSYEIVTSRGNSPGVQVYTNVLAVYAL